MCFSHTFTSITSKEEFTHQLPVKNPVLDNFVFEFDRMTSDLFASSRVPGAAIAIVKEGRVIYQKGMGVKNGIDREPIDTHTVFKIASVSKTFAGILTSMMVDRGVLDWDDPVQQWYPEFRLKSEKYTSEMRIRHLLSHSTGLVQHAYTNLIEESKDFDFMVHALPEVDLISAPGRSFSYQNVAFGVIEPVLKAATGHSYTDLIKSEIFGPLNMHDASLDYESFISTENKAYPMFAKSNGWGNGKISSTYYEVPSAGGINASISDMASYMIALTGYRPEIINENMLKEAFTPQVSTDIRSKYFGRWKDYKRSYYALGWRIVENGDDVIAYHGGYVNGYRSQLAVNLDEDVAICVLSNSQSDFSSILVPAFLRLYDMHKDEIRKEQEMQIAYAF